MKCPKCDAETRVIDSRAARMIVITVRRRRVCMECGERFTTYEVGEDAAAVLRKRSGGIAMVERLRRLAEEWEELVRTDEGGNDRVDTPPVSPANA